MNISRISIDPERARDIARTLAVLGGLLLLGAAANAAMFLYLAFIA
jgi:hypothetical protein